MIRSILNKIEEKTGFPVKHFTKFAIVGSSGVIVNISVFFFLNEILNIDYKISSIIAIETSIISNFLLNYFWTWKDKKEKNFMAKFFKFHLISFFAGLINYIVLITLVSRLDFNKYIANFIGILSAFLVNFILNHFWNFKR